jgi:hypothetical protein
MSKRARIWIVVADAGDARIVTPRLDEPGYDIVAELGAPADDNAVSTADAGRPGRFLRSVATHINREAGRGAFDKLILIGPQRPVAELQSCLGTIVQRRIKATRALDLAKVPLDELSAQLLMHLDPLE